MVVIGFSNGRAPDFIRKFFKSLRTKAPNKRVASGYYSVLADDLKVSFLNKSFTAAELNDAIKKGDPIKFIYRNKKVVKVIPSNVSDRSGEYILSAYTIDDKENKKWRRFIVEFMEKIDL